jgi:hypothetical protein
MRAELAGGFIHHCLPCGQCAIKNKLPDVSIFAG